MGQNLETGTLETRRRQFKQDAVLEDATRQGDDLNFPWEREPADPIAVTEVVAIEQIA